MIMKAWIIQILFCFSSFAALPPLPKPLLLNGTGIRKATILGIKVYAIHLFLEEKSNDPVKIINSSSPKKIELNFMHDVSVEKIQNSWNEALENCDPNLVPNCKNMAEMVKQLNEMMEDIKSGDSMTYDFPKDRVEVIVKGKKKGFISGSDFQKFVLATWLGEHPPSKDLKDGMLGKNLKSIILLS